MDRGNGNRPKKTKAISKSRKNRLDMCANIPKVLLLLERENNKIVTLAPNKILRKSVIAGVYFSQNVCNFRRGFSCCP